MATDVITVGPGRFTIGADTDLTVFSGQVTSLRLVPSVDVGDAIYVLDGGEVSGDRTESWTVAGTMLQDFGATTSKTEWLFTHRGEDMAFSYAPSSALGKEITGTLTVEAIEIGGDVKSKPTSDFEFKLVGPPAIGTITP